LIKKERYIYCLVIFVGKCDVLRSQVFFDESVFPTFPAMVRPGGFFYVLVVQKKKMPVNRGDG